MAEWSLQRHVWGGWPQAPTCRPGYSGNPFIQTKKSIGKKTGEESELKHKQVQTKYASAYIVGSSMKRFDWGFLFFSGVTTRTRRWVLKWHHRWMFFLKKKKSAASKKCPRNWQNCSTVRGNVLLTPECYHGDHAGNNSERFLERELTG